MLGRVINSADSIFKAEWLIPLSRDKTSEAENKAAPLTHWPLGLEKFWFQKWTWHAKIPLETKFQVSMTSILKFMVVFNYIYNFWNQFFPKPDGLWVTCAASFSTADIVSWVSGINNSTSNMESAPFTTLSKIYFV